jgi:hypothetical protein
VSSYDAPNEKSSGRRKHRLACLSYLEPRARHSKFHPLHWYVVASSRQYLHHLSTYSPPLVSCNASQVEGMTRPEFQSYRMLWKFHLQLQGIIQPDCSTSKDVRSGPCFREVQYFDINRLTYKQRQEQWQYRLMDQYRG